ncbi:DnaA regulatory inactivator Hda [Brachymonas denitrificans]|uniref:DnaA regulatory inactivator Hda n=1 Tax=Brachymonas denitrificans TaxID=28220 RepID=UPI002AFF5BF1|nr:DnaA regulatory inactivator Hda [Brachymonas denitrificans]
MKQIPLDIGLTPRPRLHTLVEGENGRLLTHVREALQQRQPQTVPTYVWGPGGSGKTHLLQAVMQELHEQGLSAGWLDASTPCGGYAREFDPRWSAVLLDEVELYSPEQQHTAFNWFINAMTPQQGEPRWVLAAGSLPVADLPLREDLRTRLGWGQVHALQPLGDEDVRKALQQGAAERGLELGDEVVNYMLSRFSRDLGSLNELLGMLDGYALEQRRALTVPLLKQMLNET